jgi:hypothetical protein
MFQRGVHQQFAQARNRRQKMEFDPSLLRQGNEQ